MCSYAIDLSRVIVATCNGWQRMEWLRLRLAGGHYRGPILQTLLRESPKSSECHFDGLVHADLHSRISCLDFETSNMKHSSSVFTELRLTFQILPIVKRVLSANPTYTA
jgi:hypothetical protein